MALFEIKVLIFFFIKMYCHEIEISACFSYMAKRLFKKNNPRFCCHSLTEHFHQTLTIWHTHKRRLERLVNIYKFFRPTLTLFSRIGSEGCALHCSSWCIWWIMQIWFITSPTRLISILCYLFFLLLLRYDGLGCVTSTVWRRKSFVRWVCAIIFWVTPSHGLSVL